MRQKRYLELKQASNQHTPSNLANSLGFEKALFLACDMLNNEEWDESLQVYAANLLEELRAKYTEKWNSNWRYDALLGYAYDIVLNYDERYLAYKRAYDKVNPKPPQLLVAMAHCCWAPGMPPITEEEAILLVKEAIKTIPYIEGVELLRGLYKSIGNIKEQKRWEKVLESIQKDGVHLPSLCEIPKTNEM